MRALFICTGNTCRSPMAQYIFNHLCQTLDIDSEAESCGFAAMPGDDINPNSLAALAEMGIDANDHRARRFNIYMVDEFDKIFVFSPAAKQALQGVLSSKQAKKVYLLGEGIPDPYGQSMEIYRICRDKIKQEVEHILFDQPMVTAKPVTTVQQANQVYEIGELCLKEENWTLQQYIDEIDRDSMFLCLSDGDSVFAFLQCDLVADDLHLNLLAVSPDYRRRGFAKLLMQYAEQIAKELNPHTVFSLEVRAQNTAANALYQSWGFTAAGVRKNFYQDPQDDAVIYIKEI